MSKIVIESGCSVWRDMNEGLHVSLPGAHGDRALASIIVKPGDCESPEDFAAFQNATALRVTFEVVGTKGSMQLAQEDLASCLSVAVGSTASRRVTVQAGTTEVMGEGGAEQVADLKATRNDRGGIDYELTIDPISMGVAPGQVS